MSTLSQWLYALPPESVKLLNTALLEADIARAAGNKDWRRVFERYQAGATGKLKKIFAALRKQKGERAMEVYWQELRKVVK